MGLGLDVGRDWLNEARAKKVHVRIGGSRECLWCNQIYYHKIWRDDRLPYTEKLCNKCVGMVTRDMATL